MLFILPDDKTPDMLLSINLKLSNLDNSSKILLEVIIQSQLFKLSNIIFGFLPNKFLINPLLKYLISVDSLDFNLSIKSSVSELDISELGFKYLLLNS